MLKKCLSVIVALIVVNQCVAQWVSNGNGDNFTLQSISEIAPNVVQALNDGNYKVLQDLKISENDTLTFLSSDNSVVFSGNVTLEFAGTLITENRDSKLQLKGNQNDESFFNIRFDNSSNSNLANVDIQYCFRILLINSNIEINNCEFHDFSNHVISFMNCNPVIKNSYFHDNQYCAIQSAINTDGCPQIINNHLYNNVLSNTNNPQINIGPGTTDTIRIIGNIIEGFNSTMSGGIGISNMYNADITKVIVKDNVVKNNRYGYAQNGYRIESQIINNQFVDNNLEVNPNNGGSGISIFGYDESCASKIRNNLITGNLWGITAIYYNNIDLGTENDFGYNVIYDNGNNGTEYALFNNSNSDIDAVGNYWGGDNIAQAEDVIFHQADSSIYGLVNYLPINVIEPEITSFVFLKEKNPFLQNDCYGEISDTGQFITVFVAETFAHPELMDQLKPSISTPFGVTVTPSDDDYVDFGTSPVYKAMTPHNSYREYNVYVINLISVEEFDNHNLKIYPNPVVSGNFNIENNNSRDLNWKLFSIEGKMISSGILLDGNNQISTQNLKSGAYILRIEEENTNFDSKIIIK